jgi:hypothetical protein
MEKAQKPSNYVCYTPSSEPFRIYRLRVFENRTLNGILDPKRKQFTEDHRIMMNFRICVLHQILLGPIRSKWMKCVRKIIFDRNIEKSCGYLN